MSRRCDICGKGVQTGFNVSHSHLKTKKKWRPNVKKIKISINGRSEYKKVCTRCMRTDKVVKPAAVARNKKTA